MRVSLKVSTGTWLICGRSILKRSILQAETWIQLWQDMTWILMPSQLNSVSSFPTLVVYFANLAWVLEIDRVVYYSSRSTTDVSIFQLWARNWGHIRATCESSCLTGQLCRDYGIEICFGLKNPNLSVSVSSPPNLATFRILDEGDDPCCPGNMFYYQFW